MSTQRKPDAEREDYEKPVVQKPENFDLEKGLANVKRIVKKNQEWVREMASK